MYTRQVNNAYLKDGKWYFIEYFYIDNMIKCYCDGKLIYERKPGE